MSRQEFLTILKEALEMDLTPQEVMQNINYYDGYIAGEMAKGMTEEEVIARLGDPRMIAKSIVEAANAGKGQSGESYGYERSGSGNNMHESGEDSYQNRTGGTRFEYNRNGKSYHVSGQTAGIIAAAVLILLLVFVVRIVGGIVSFILPVLVPVLLILIGINLLRRR